MINRMMPRGFKLDLHDFIEKTTEAHYKKPAHMRVPEIANEKKQEKIMQKFYQKR
jgi:hypothetical protein